MKIILYFMVLNEIFDYQKKLFQTQFMLQYFKA